MDYKSFKLERFEFSDEWYRKGNRLHKMFLRPSSKGVLFDTGPDLVYLKDAGTNKLPRLEDLCEAIGFDDSSLTGILAYHRKRFNRSVIIRIFINLIVTLIAAGIFSSGITWLIEYLLPSIASFSIKEHIYSITLISYGLTFLFVVIAALFAFVVIRINFKLASALTRSRFADTICIYTVVYLVIELSRDDVLSDPVKRRSLIARISNLAQKTYFLSLRFASKSEMNQSWLKEHFGHMKRYIQERARWATVPVETTLSDLRQDFYNLTVIYITGDYGKFIWDAAPPVQESTSPTETKGILATVPKIIGIILPLVLLPLLFWQHQRLESIGISTNITALILVAWLLLAIDAALRLGIVANVVSLAKSIKDLK